MHADPALRKLAARGMVSSMADLPPPVGELHGRVKCKHLQLCTLKLILIAVPNFVRAVFHKKPGGMIRQFPKALIGVRRLRDVAWDLNLLHFFLQ